MPHITSISIGPLIIQVWGFFLALGFLVGTSLVLHEAKKVKIKTDHVWNLAILAIIGAVVGSRLLFVFEHREFFSRNLGEIFWVNSGGMSFWGGLVLAVLLASIYVRIQKLDFWKIADLAPMGITAGYVLGRIGCLVADFHPGKLTNSPWAVDGRQPVVLYYILAGIVILVILRIVGKKFKNPGNFFLLFLALFSLHRILIDFFRATDLLNADPQFWGLFVAQWVGLAVLGLVSGLFFKRQSC